MKRFSDQGQYTINQSESWEGEGKGKEKKEKVRRN